MFACNFPKGVLSFGKNQFCQAMQSGCVEQTQPRWLFDRPTMVCSRNTEWQRDAKWWQYKPSTKNNNKKHKITLQARYTFKFFSRQSWQWKRMNRSGFIDCWSDECTALIVFLFFRFFSPSLSLFISFRFFVVHSTRHCQHPMMMTYNDNFW